MQDDAFDAALRPQLDPDDEIHFLDSHRPPLAAGDYEIEVSQTVVDHGLTMTRRLDFVVQGPRFRLLPADLGAVYPPKGSVGDFGSCLPHILLKRATLPWDRSAQDHEDPKGRNLPWLALLVFTEAELVGCTRMVKAAELLNPAKGDGFGTLPADHSVVTDAMVKVLDLPRALAEAVLPAAQDLPWLCSVRDITRANPHPGAPTDEARAIIMANRLPHADPKVETRHIAHLLSLESQYTMTANGLAHRLTTTKDRTVRIVSLADWTFTCHSDHGDLQKTLAEGLELKALRLPNDVSGPSAALVRDGFAALQSTRRDGAAEPVWYQGPLNNTGGNTHLPVDRLPARRAEDILPREQGTGMFDISAPAAWELGRLLALRSPEVGLSLRRWKREMAQTARANAGAATHPELLDMQEEPEFPLRDWFEGALINLEKVPFDFLVPHPDMLPAEAIVPFEIDSNWIKFLIDGAFSIGRTSAAQIDQDAALQAHLPAAPHRSGVLIRSKIVRGFPDLEVDGILRRDGSKAVRQRFVRLAGDVLLVIFDRWIDQIDVHLHPQMIHFGLDGTEATGWHKAGLNVTLRGGAGRVLEVGRMAAATAGAGAFALKMIEPVPKVSFLIEVPR